MALGHKVLILEQLRVEEAIRRQLHLRNKVFLAFRKDLTNNVPKIPGMLLQPLHIPFRHGMHFNSIFGIFNTRYRHVGVEHPWIYAFDARDILRHHYGYADDFWIAVIAHNLLLFPDLLQVPGIDRPLHDCCTQDSQIVHGQLGFAYIVRSFELVLDNILHALYGNGRIYVGINLWAL